MDNFSAPDNLPTTRQKNCNSCVQAKRRCDRRTPICSRCADKNVACTYGKINLASRPDRGLSEPVAVLPGVNDLGPLPIDAQLGVSTTESLENYFVDACFDGDFAMDPFNDLMGSSITPSQDRCLIQIEQGPVNERPGSPVDEEVVRAYAKMADVCDDVKPWHLYDSTTPLHHIVTRVKGFTADVATRNATPFLHRYLYRDHTPPCILSCFTICVLYANRTPANAVMVMQALHSSVKELLVAETGRVVAMPVEKLARAQALFLYQIIRLLDGDVALRAQGENDIPLLKTWLGELCKVRENLGDLAQLGDSVKRIQHPGEWENWIFAESVRRTIIMAHSFMNLYEMMKGPDEYGLTFSLLNCLDADGGSVDDGFWDYVHRWTLSRHLWEADSPFEFARAWKEKHHFVITNYSFERFLEYGKGEDVDEFAEILLKVYLGVDETNELLSHKGARERPTVH